MQITPLTVYKTIEIFRLKASGKKIPSDSSLSYLWNNRVKQNIKGKVINMYSFINSSHYNIEDLLARVWLYYIYQDRNIWYDCEAFKSIVNAKESYFSKKRLSADKIVIIELSKTTKLKSIEEFFEIGDGGECPAFVLLKQQYISPLFYMRYMGYITNEIKSNKKQKRVNDIMRIIQGDTHG